MCRGRVREEVPQREGKEAVCRKRRREGDVRGEWERPHGGGGGEAGAGGAPQLAARLRGGIRLAKSVRVSEQLLATCLFRLENTKLFRIRSRINVLS